MPVEIDMARQLIRKKAPFFHRMTVRMVFKESTNTQMGTIETTKNAVVSYDKAWFGKFSFRIQAGLIIHEAFHLWLDSFGRRGTRDPQMFNVAADMAANCIIRELGFELPTGDDKGCFPEDIIDPKTGKPAAPSLSAEEYYDMMKQNQQKTGNASGKGDGKKPGGDKPGPGHGKCGSCAGNGSGHVDEADSDGRSDGAIQRAAREVSEGIKTAAAKGHGKLPEALKRLADVSLSVSEVPWQTVLRHEMASAARTVAGNMLRKWDRPSKQQACVGYGNNVAILPRLRAPIPEIAEVIDTSGSMGAEELSVALGETAAIIKAMGGAQITVLSCDAKVHARGKVVDARQILPLLKGGGGTDFRPAFDELKKNAPDICVFFTDGAGTFPSAPPPFKVIWVLTGKYKVPASSIPFGKVIVVK